MSANTVRKEDPDPSIPAPDDSSFLVTAFDAASIALLYDLGSAASACTSSLRI